MKTFEQMNDDEKVVLYKSIDKKIEKAEETTAAYVEKMEWWQKAIVEDLQGAQLEIDFNTLIKERIQEAYQRRDDVTYNELKAQLLE